MVGITQGTSQGYSVYEFQVFGNPASACRAPVGLSATTSLPVPRQRPGRNTLAGITQYIIKYHSNLSASWLMRTATTGNSH